MAYGFGPSDPDYFGPNRFIVTTRDKFGNHIQVSKDIHGEYVTRSRFSGKWISIDDYHEEIDVNNSQMQAVVRQQNERVSILLDPSTIVENKKKKQMEEEKKAEEEEKLRNLIAYYFNK